MTEVTLKMFVEFAMKKASQIFKQSGRLLPMYHAMDGEGHHLVFTPPHPDKDVSIALVRDYLANCNAVRVAYIDEAWMMEGPSDLDLGKIGREGVEKQPGRIEVIIINAEDEHEGFLMARREIIRHGKRAVLGKLTLLDSNELKGRMVGMLPVRGTRQ